MDEFNSLGQGINALIPPKNVNPLQPTGEETQSADNLSAGDWEQKISEKINNTFSDFPEDLAARPDPLKKEFQEDWQKVHWEEDTVRRDEEKEKTSPLLGGTEGFLAEDKIFHIELDKIKPNSEQPRKVFTDETIKELAGSIREHGILEPLVVVREEEETESGADVKYQLISGERRLLAAKTLGLPTVPVIIRKPMDEKKKLELALIENIQREDLTPISKAQAFARLIRDFGLTQQSLAERVGKSREVVANTLRLLQLSHEAQQALESGKINEGHARAILLFGNPEKRRLFLNEILTKGLSGREALDLAQHYLQGHAGRQNADVASRRRNVSLDPEDMEVKEKLEDLLQTPVVIKKKGGQGAIEIKFFSAEDLNKILNRIFPL